MRKCDVGFISLFLLQTPSPSCWEPRTPEEVLPSIVSPFLPFHFSTIPACPKGVVPLLQTIIVPAGNSIFLEITSVALIVLFLVAKCRASPDPVNGGLFPPAESRQKLTNAAHHCAPGFNPHDLRNLETQYPELFPSSLTPINPFAIKYVL